MSFWDTPSSVSVKLPFRWRISFGKKLQDLNWLAIKVKKPSYKIETSPVKYLKTHTFNFPKTLVWQPIQITLIDARILDPTETRNKKMDMYTTTDSINLPISPSSKISNNSFQIITSSDTGNARADSNSTDNYKKVPFSTQAYFVKFLEEAGYYNPEEYTREDALYRFRTVPFKQDLAGALVGVNKDYTDYYAAERDSLTTGAINSTKNFNTLNIQELDPEGYVIEKWEIYNPLVTSVTFGDLDYTTDAPLNVTVDITYDWAKLNTDYTDSLNATKKNKNDEYKKKELERLNNDLKKQNTKDIATESLIEKIRKGK